VSAGRLITFEGVEGSGKSTLMATLATRVEAAGYTVARSREPGGTKVGERIRDIVLDADHPVEPLAELFLMLSARAQVVGELIRPALDRHEVVLCDRYMDASTAYQGIARGLGRERVEELNRLATGDLSPDLTLLVDLDPSVGRARMQRSFDRMEREDLEFHGAVREGYLELARLHPERFCVLDGILDPAGLAREAWGALGRVLAKLPDWTD
jgi:dTMP kinase